MGILNTGRAVVSTSGVRSRATSGRLLPSIAVHELRTAWRGRSLHVLAAILTALLAGSAVVGHARDRTESAQRQRYQRIVGEQFARQPDRHPHRVSHYGYLLFRPPAPLGFLDSGLEPFTGTSLFLEAHRQNTASFSAASQGGDGQRLGELTVVGVLQLLVPLLVFAVAGVSVTREREAGTLPLLLCQGASWSQILWGKLWGQVLTFSVVLAPGLVAAAIWLAIQSDVRWTLDIGVRLAAIAAVHLVFLTGCAAVGVIVSAWQRSSRRALVILVGVWSVLWIVLPRALPVATTALYPVPARATFDAEVEARVMELGDTHNPDDPVFARFREETLRRHGVTRVEDLPINYNGLLMSKGEEVSTAAYREHLGALLNVYKQQARLIELAGAISPYLAVRLTSSALAGSDLAHQIEFERQAEDYRFRLVQALNELHAHRVTVKQDRYGGIVNGAPSRHRIDATFFDRLPTFVFVRPTIAWALREQAIGFLAGALGSVAIFAALVWTASRMRSLQA